MADNEYVPPPEGFVLGYFDGWTDAKAGRQYGEGRQGAHAATVGKPEPSCGVISMSGPRGEPLACGFFVGHAGPHAWASLPTWTDGDIATCSSCTAIHVLHTGKFNPDEERNNVAT